MALSVGHPRRTHSRYMIGCCPISLGICGLKTNSRRITYGRGCVRRMRSLSPLSSLASNLCGLISNRGIDTICGCPKRFHQLVTPVVSFPQKINQCTLQLKYTKVLSSHSLIIAALYGMAWPNSLVRNFKNFKIVLSELSPNLAMILVPDFFLTRLDGAIYRLEGLNKRLI